MVAEIRPYWRNFIDGEWLDSSDGRSIPIVDPSNGKLISRVACGGAVEIDLAVAAARRCFQERRLQSLTPAARGELMFAIAGELETLAD
ncbi:aldehyde dehydrogenase family protein, partial [Mesorhizobium sp.]|uniref:aldehyde dehydrogenase family protein n=1 Tax=Mesorhizobium sp. TaxID=1871066 RepID=UPI0025BD272B